MKTSSLLPRSASYNNGPHLLIVTDNRFWREQLGSQKRIHSLIKHLENNGITINALFLGNIYQDDIKIGFNTKYSFKITVAEHEHQNTKNTSLSKLKSFILNAKEFFFTEAKRRLYSVRQYPRRKMLLQFKEPRINDFFREEYLTNFENLCSSIKPNIIIVEFVRLAYLLKYGRLSIPENCICIIDTIDVQYERQTRFHARNEVHDIDITPDEEATALAHADVILAIQATDAEKLRDLVPDVDILVVGHPAEVKRTAITNRAPVRVGFIGSDMTPNVSAAKRLINDIFMPLCAEINTIKAELNIFGSVCESLIALKGLPRVNLHGFQPDLDSVFNQIDIMVNPIEFGGGLKIKNVEALCRGLPLLTTIIGAEGLEDGISNAFIVAETNQEFRDRLADLILNFERRSYFADAAYRYASERFNEKATYRELDLYISERLKSQKSD